MIIRNALDLAKYHHIKLPVSPKHPDPARLLKRCVRYELAQTYAVRIEPMASYVKLSDLSSWEVLGLLPYPFDSRIYQSKINQYLKYR